MKSIAHELLHRLLAAGNRAKAGIRTRGAALTAAQMSAYRGLRDLRQKQDCEEVFLAAKDAGHIAVQRDPANPTDGLIDRIELRDIEGLARFLGVQSYEAVLIQARQQLAPLLDSHPVLQEVLQRWAAMGRVRGLGPDDVTGWLDGAKLIAASAQRLATDVDLPLREYSTRIFKDSKRLEKIVAELDVLLCGSIDAAARSPAEVWQELGLLPQEHPVLLAGAVTVARGRVTSLLDEPYSGLPAVTIRALVGEPPRC